MADTTLTLALPLGLPDAGTDAAAFFTDLGSRIRATVTGNCISAWTDPDALYSGVGPMIKAAVWYVRAGDPGLDGTTPVTSNTLYCKTWLWQYISLRTAAGGGSTLLPAVIALANLEEAAVQSAVSAELAGNSKYANLTDDERATSLADFLAGSARLVADAGTCLGCGEVDTSQADGYRRADVTLFDADGNSLDPAFYFSLWDTIGGTLVDGHPLIPLVQGPVTPALAPIEGGIRVRVTGTGLSDGSVVIIGGAEATDAWAGSGGTTLYVTVPEGTAGPVDVTVDGTAYAGAFAYTEDVLATAQAAVLAYMLALGEVSERAAALSAAGSLDDAAREDLLGRLYQAGLTTGQVIEERSANAGAAAIDTGAETLLSDSLASLQTLVSDAMTAIS